MSAAVLSRRQPRWFKLDFRTGSGVEALSLIAGLAIWQIAGGLGHQQWLPPLSDVLGKIAGLWTDGQLQGPLIESLMSYIHRLAWSYRVSARALVKREILPRLGDALYVRSSPQQLGGFGRCRAMSINGAGALAADWARTLERLTARTDLWQLTIRPWAAGLPIRLSIINGALCSWSSAFQA